MALSPFELEHRRLEAARRLPASCFDEFQRLSRSLIHGPEFQWLLVDASHQGLRKQVTAALNEVLSVAGLRVNRLPVTQRVMDVAALEARLVKNAGQAEVVHVLVARGWFTAARWDAFNARRERLASQARARLVFWLDEPAIVLASQAAPDLWAWRGGVYRFVPEGSVQWPAQRSVQSGISAQPDLFRRWEILDSATMAERHRRIVEIRQWLAAHPDAPDELKIAPMDELGRLLYGLGSLDEAMAHWRDHELLLHRRLGDARGVAIVQGQIADVLQARGELDEALRIRREEQLPVYEKLGDQRSRAVTMGKIADVLQARGELDEALRIRREEQLPVFEKLGDQRSLLVGRANLALLLLEIGRTQQRAEAQSLLRLAFDTATRMGLPEGAQIKAIFRKNFGADL